MKVYSSPIPFEYDYSDYNHKAYCEAEDKHQETLKAWLVENGYTGKNTGRILSEPVADGSAMYMLAEGKRSFLVHLPYGDAYQSRDVSFLPKAEVLRRIEAKERLNELFKKAS